MHNSVMSPKMKFLTMLQLLNPSISQSLVHKHVHSLVYVGWSRLVGWGKGLNREQRKVVLMFKVCWLSSFQCLSKGLFGNVFVFVILFLYKLMKYCIEFDVGDNICTKLLLFFAFIFRKPFKKQKGFIIRILFCLVTFGFLKTKTANKSNAKRALNSQMVLILNLLCYNINWWIE